MVMSFDLTARQHDLRSRSRQFAENVLREVKVTAERLPASEERFIATKPAYEQLVADGFLRACLPAWAGGENRA